MRIWRAVAEALCDAPDLICVALSGGEDSHVLLHALLNCGSTASVGSLPAIHVLHVNHRLRYESDWEALFVRQLSAHYGLELSIFDAPEKPDDENVEAWARKQRYDFFSEFVRNAEASVSVWTGHHMQDQAETVLQRLFDGRLLTTGGGIAKQNEGVVRPLLHIAKDEIAKYRAHFGLSVVFDSSNRDQGRTRNRIRHGLLAELAESYNPQIVASLCHTAERLGRDEAFIDSVVGRRLEELGERIAVETLKAVPEALQWRLLKALAVAQVGSDARQLGYRSMMYFRDILFADSFRPDAVHDLGFGIVGGLSTSGVVTYESSSGRTGQAALPGESREQGFSFVDIPGSCSFNRCLHWMLTAEILDRSQAPNMEEVTRADTYGGLVANRAECFFDADQLRDMRLCIRSRADGDRMDVWGRGHRKVKKLLQEKGVARALRDSVPLVTQGEEILWIPGVARCAAAAIKDSSARIVKVSCIRRQADSPIN